MLEGISPHNWFLDRSRESNACKKPISNGILPVKRFLERFKEINPSSFKISQGIVPTNLLLEKSMLFTSPRILWYSRSLPFHIQIARSSYLPAIKPFGMTKFLYELVMVEFGAHLWVKAMILLRHVGILPEIWFTARSKIWSWVRWHRCEGMQGTRSD